MGLVLNKPHTTNKKKGVQTLKSKIKEMRQQKGLKQIDQSVLTGIKTPQLIRYEKEYFIIENIRLGT